MKSTDVIQPQTMKTPIAINGSRDNIPQNQSETENPWYCSIENGFPDITMQALKDGGKPPRGQGANGLFYLSTDQRVYLQNGGIITFNQSVSDAIGGYPKNAVLDYIDPDDTYHKVQSLIDDNTYNFITNPEYLDETHWKEISLGGGGSGHYLLELVPSIFPLNEAGIHLTDGSLISQQGVYSQGVAKIKKIVEEYPQFSKTEEEWQELKTTYGEAPCIVIDDEAGTLRLPLIVNPIKGVTNFSDLAKIIEAGIPNVTGTVGGVAAYRATGPFRFGTARRELSYDGGCGCADSVMDLSRSNPIYGNSDTVQPQQPTGCYYIVLATKTKTEVEVDIDNIVSDLNLKADIDAGNFNAAGKAAIARLAAFGKETTDSYPVNTVHQALTTMWANISVTNAGSETSYERSLAMGPTTDLGILIGGFFQAGTGGAGRWLFPAMIPKGWYFKINSGVRSAGATGVTLYNAMGEGE